MKGLNLPPFSVDLASAISLLAVKPPVPCSGERGWKGQSSRAKHGPGERQLFCRGCRCRFLTGLGNNKFSIKPASSSRLGAPCRGGSGSSCAARRFGAGSRNQHARRETPEIQRDRKQLKSLEFAQVLGVVTPSPTKLQRPHVAWSLRCVSSERQRPGTGVRPSSSSSRSR